MVEGAGYSPGYSELSLSRICKTRLLRCFSTSFIGNLVIRSSGLPEKTVDGTMNTSDLLLRKWQVSFTSVTPMISASVSSTWASGICGKKSMWEMSVY